MRDQETINSGLGNSPLPYHYTQLPIYNHMEDTISDDLDLGGCGYVDTVDGYRFPAESTYQSVEWLKDDLRDPISDAFGLSDHERETMSFMDLYNHCDIVQSNSFEGLGYGYNYTMEQLNEINQTVLATLVLPLQDPVLSRNMYVSKQLRLPLSLMTRFTQSAITGDG